MSRTFAYRIATPHRLAVIEALRGGDWIGITQLADRLVGIVPDELAVWRYEQQYETRAHRLITPRDMLPAEKAALGRRVTVLRTLKELEQDGWQLIRQGVRADLRLRAVVEGPLVLDGRAKGNRLSRGTLTHATILGVLKDGRWHEVDALADALVGVVDPGEATRLYVNKYKHWRRRDGSRLDHEILQGAGLVKKGLRARAHIVLRDLMLRHDALITYDGHGPSRRVRMVRPPAYVGTTKPKHVPEAAQ